MADETDTEIELKKVQLDAAKIDLEAKRLDLRRRPSNLWNALFNPVVVAAAITAAVSISSYFISEHQKGVEAERAEAQSKLAAKKAADEAELASKKAADEADLQQRKIEADMILEVVRTYNPDQAATNLQFLVDAGLVPKTAPRLMNYLANRPAGRGKVLPPGGGLMPINPPR
jgi:hypothetical protein